MAGERHGMCELAFTPTNLISVSVKYRSPPASVSTVTHKCVLINPPRFPQITLPLITTTVCIWQHHSTFVRFGSNTATAATAHVCPSRSARCHSIHCGKYRVFTRHVYPFPILCRTSSDIMIFLFPTLFLIFNPFQSNFFATRILPSSYLFWAGKTLMGYL
jgi:hypothetical protein